MMVSKEQIASIIEKTDIVELVSKYVNLQKSGSGYKGLCPFHDDNSPSFSVSPSKKIAKCMSCGEGGNPITFLMKIENISFNEALSILADKCGEKIDLNVVKKKDDHFLKYYQINQLSLKFFQRNLITTKGGQIALNYLYKRGLNDEIIEKFKIGLAPSNYNNLYEILKEASYLPLDMMDIGLVNAHNDNYVDVFNKRITFPILDESSNIVGFSGRSYTPDVEPKYLNTQDTIIFKKGNILYNLCNAIPSIRKKKRVILYEGFMDVIASYKAGLTEGVCSMGTALGINQARLIKKYTDNVIICYDGDRAGINASYKAIKILKQANLNIRLVMLKDNMDPDEFVFKYGVEEYSRYFNENIIDEYEYFYQNTCKSLNINDFKSIDDTKTSIFNMLNSVNNNTLTEIYLNRLSKDMNVSVVSLYGDYQNYFNKSNKSKNVEIEYDNKNLNFDIDNTININGLNKYQVASLRLLNHAKKNRKQAFDIEQRITLEVFDKPYYELWIQLIDGYYKISDETSKYNIFETDKFYKFDETIFQKILSKDKELYNTYLKEMNLLEQKVSVPYTNEDLDMCIEALKEQEILMNIKRLSKLDNKNEDEQVSSLQQKVNELKLVNEAKNKKRK